MKTKEALPFVKGCEQPDEKQPAPSTEENGGLFLCIDGVSW